MLKYFYKKPIITGVIGFLILLVITQMLTFKEYRLVKSIEKDLVEEKLTLLENQLISGLSFGLSATKTLEILLDRIDLESEFEEVASEIISGNPYVDAIQLLDSGTITRVYPVAGNENALGYNILKDEKRRTDAIRAIKERKMFYAGPFELVQGGAGIVGRLPLYKDEKFVGFTAVIIKLETFYKILGRDFFDLNRYYYQFSKINPDNGQEDFFLPLPTSELSGHKESVSVEMGDWILTVQLKESKAYDKAIVLFIFRLLFSILAGCAIWYLADQPYKLNRKVEEQAKAIRLNNERFSYAVEATSDAIWDWDLENDQIYRSDNFQKLFGHPIDAYTTNNQFWLKNIHAEDVDRTSRKIYEFFKSDKTRWVQEFRFRKADGTYAFVVDKGIVIRDSQGKPIRMIGATQDITEIRAKEQELLNVSSELIERTKELEISNLELEQFAYTVSHDLQEPLRMITGFMQLLNKKYEPILDAKGKKYIHFAIDGAARMRQIILDLLEYSTSGNNDSQEKVCLSKVMGEILEIEKQQIENLGAVVRVGSLPEIIGSRISMFQLLKNLFENALKYRSLSHKPEIHINAMNADGYHLITFEDNGIGINPEHNDTIFQLFKRLHTTDEYSGTGIGLALAKKIVESHSGRIWVEPSTSGGSVFKFILKQVG